MNSNGRIEDRLEELGQTIESSESFVNNVMSRVNTISFGEAKIGLSTWRIIMRSKMTKLAVAAAIVVVGFLVINVPAVSAAEKVLSDAIEALSELRSVYMQLRIRTAGHDNFELVRPEYDFVSNEIWKEYDGTNGGKWRVEKAGRVVVMDGESTTLLIRPNEAAKFGPRSNIVYWLKRVMDVDKVLESELRMAVDEGSELELRRETSDDGREKLVVVVEAKAQGEYTNDYLRNSSIEDSDNQRVYWFDAETKLLEGLEVYMHTDDGDVLVLEMVEITYNVEIEPAMFVLEMPDDVIWSMEPEELGQEYQQMGPKEVAEGFFAACSVSDWDEVGMYLSQSGVSDKIKDYVGGLEVISVGDPFKSGLYPGWFVPYEIKMRWGGVKKFNLAVRNDNKAKRYIVDGGF